jgi:hypothetical protein
MQSRHMVHDCWCIDHCILQSLQCWNMVNACWSFLCCPVLVNPFDMSLAKRIL